MTIPVLVTLNFTDVHLERLRSVSADLDVVRVPARSSEEVAEALNARPETEVLYTLRMPACWEEQWAVQWVQFHSAGVDHVDFDQVPAHVRLTTASGVHAVVLAEHTLALLLALWRHVPRMLAFQARRQWPEGRWSLFAAPLLRGHTVGILGYGSIGREVARVFHALGMEVLAYKRNPARTRDTGFALPGVGDPEGAIPRAYYGPGQLHELLAQCDVVVNVLPATPETENLLNAKAFAAMKPGSIFINIGRGKTVDEVALVAALQHGPLAAAGLDVFAQEPLPAESPLWELENVVISPHVGGFFQEYDDVCVELFRHNLARYVAGRPLLNEVNRNTGY
ncbi:MAG: D-2-hydroxyacid dehydrogenase [Ardenticatenia bacterium]|nr:D-2-hydroxyacid dehydrogenase [Ardenticatenia bacterium]